MFCMLAMKNLDSLGCVGTAQTTVDLFMLEEGFTKAGKR